MSSLSNEEKIKYIVEKSITEFNTVMDNWCNNYKKNFSGGKMRSDRGDNIEKFVIFLVMLFKTVYGVNVSALKGDKDKKTLEVEVKGRTIKKDHQVDVHIYLNGIFVAVIECKAYLDCCYYKRACDDFHLFKKFGYNIKKYVFSLEDSISEETRMFIDHSYDHSCDDVFYILDGKRNSSKPIYKEEYKKNINEEKLTRFVKSLQELLIN